MKKLAPVLLIQIVLLVPIFLLAAPASAQTMQPGLWEMTSTSTGMSMPGMEDMPPEAMAAMGGGQSTSFRHCLSAEDAAGGPGRASAASKGQCKVINQRTSGASFETTLACDDGAGGPIQIHTKGTSSPARFDATSEITMASEGMTMTSKVSGKFLGPCK